MKHDFRKCFYLTLSLSIAANGCTLVYNATTSSSSRPIGCDHNDCWIEIHPSRTQATRLTIITDHGNSVDIYLSERVSSDKMICDPLFNYVGNQVTTIQRLKSVEKVDNCVYCLFPSNSDNNNTETLYLLSSDSTPLHVSYSGNEESKEIGKPIIIKNWTSVHFLLDYIHKAKSHRINWMEEIVAVSTNKSCECYNMNHTINYGTVIDFQSPGYPDFNCPNNTCNSLISFAKLNTTKEYIYRAHVSLVARPLIGTSLHLKSKSMDIQFDDTSFSYLSTSFLMDLNSFQVDYKTPTLLYTGLQGQYKMTVGMIKVKKDCDCSTLFQKKFIIDWQVKIVVPFYCEIMFCDWTITKDSQNREKEMRIVLENSHQDDEVHVWNKQFMEKYKSNQMRLTRKIFLANTTSDTHIFFWRKTKGSNATFSVSWKTVADTKCKTFEHVFLTTVPQVFTSSNYPAPHNPYENCKTFLEAPADHFITVHLTDIDVEHLHDHLSFYDGNSSISNLTRHLTGKYDDLTISSNSNFMFVEFISDSHDSGRGYHLTALAVPKILSTPEVVTEISDDIYDIEAVEMAVSTIEIENKNKTNYDMPKLNSRNEWTDVPTKNINPKNISLLDVKSLESSETEQGFGILHLLIAISISVLITAVSIFGILFVMKRVSNSKKSNSFSNAMVRYRAEDSDSTATIEY